MTKIGASGPAAEAPDDSSAAAAAAAAALGSDGGGVKRRLTQRPALLTSLVSYGSADDSDSGGTLSHPTPGHATAPQLFFTPSLAHSTALFLGHLPRGAFLYVWIQGLGKSGFSLAPISLPL